MSEPHDESPRPRGPLTERRRVTRALSDSQDWLKTITDHSPTVICLSDTNGAYLFVNKRFETIHDIDAQHAIGKTPHELFPVEIADAFAEHNNAVLTAAETVEREQIVVSANGLRTFNEVRFPILTSTGKPFAIGLIGTDITDSRRGELELRTARHAVQEAESRLADAVRNMSEAIIVYDANERLVLCNDRYREFYGYSEEDTRPGITFQELVKLDLERGTVSPDQWTDEFYRYRDEQRDRLEGGMEVQLNDGRWLEIRDRTTAAGGIVSIQADITKRKLAEQRLRDSEERHALAMRGTNEGLWDWDVKTGLLHTSERFREITRVGADEPAIRPEDWISHMHPEDLEHYRADLRDHFRGDSEYVRTEFRVTDGAGGNYRWVLARGLGLRDTEGQVYRMVGSVRDITNRKKTEADLLAAKEEAEAATRAKSRFLGNMSHELRTPLNAIIGITEMLREDAEDLGHDQFNEPLDRIANAGKHLLRLINEVLDLTRVEAGRIKLDVEDFDLLAFLQDIVTTAQPLAEKNNNTLTFERLTEIGSIHADMTRIRQVLLNLLSNACKFTENGAVTLSAAHRIINNKGYLIIKVIDTGVGIPKDQQNQLFDEFSQADSSTTRKHDGAGLGLAISRRLTQLMEGDISLESTTGVGSTFTMWLPWSADKKPAPKAAGQVDTLLGSPGSANEPGRLD